jgi:hypothetical protein
MLDKHNSLLCHFLYIMGPGLRSNSQEGGIYVSSIISVTFQAYCDDAVFSEAVFLVVFDPSMNKL